VEGKAIRVRCRVGVYIAYIPFPLVHPRAVIVIAVRIRGALTVIQVLVVDVAVVVIVEMIMCVAIASGCQRSRRGCHNYIECARKIKCI